MGLQSVHIANSGYVQSERLTAVAALVPAALHWLNTWVQANREVMHYRPQDSDGYQ